jgi:hypothetical protein
VDKKFDAVALKKYCLCCAMEISIVMQQNFYRDATKFLSLCSKISITMQQNFYRDAVKFLSR